MAFASHHDIRGKSGGMMSLGAGTVISRSKKQRTNGKILMENKLIGVDDSMGSVLNTIYCKNAQGYDMV